VVKRYELSDEQYERIRDILPGKATDPGRSAQDNRRFINGVLWVLRSGARWHDMPERHGGWKSQHKRFSRRAEKGAGKQCSRNCLKIQRMIMC
jgi:transposase